MFQKIVIILTLLILCVLIINIVKNNYNQQKIDDSEQTFNIEDIVIVERPDPNIKLIDKLIHEKPYLYDIKDTDIIKKKFQVFEHKNGQFKNISKNFYNDIKNNVILN